MGRLWEGAQTAAQKRYAEKMKDPRWLRLRQTIMERDGFTCHACRAECVPLEVHHRYYEPGLEPWDYDSDALVTLCRSCHELETDYQDCVKDAERKRREFKIADPRVRADIEALCAHQQSRGEETERRTDAA